MSAESPSSRRGIVVPILVMVAIGVGLRFFFVDLLTKTTGTWIGGVESPHRTSPSPAGGSEGPSAA